MQNKVTIAGIPIGQNYKPFIIAEMSGNHNQSLEKALEIVDAAAESGAHALKLQTYTADTMTLDIDKDEFKILDPDSLWTGNTLYDLYDQAHTPWEWHAPIFERARDLGMIPFSSPFDASAVDFLETLDVDCYKIASFENTDLALIKKVASTGKPLIISTGMASLAELDESVKAARNAGCKELILLKCTSTYPASPENTNISTIPHMKALFDCEVGISDHTAGIGVSVASIALGATIVEKHFTLDRSEGGVDSSFSIEPSELKQLVLETERAHQALGNVSYGATSSEEKSLQFRRSLYIVKDMIKGEVITCEHIRSIRPGFGLPVKDYDQVIGRVVNRALARGTALSWEYL